MTGFRASPVTNTRRQWQSFLRHQCLRSRLGTRAMEKQQWQSRTTLHSCSIDWPTGWNSHIYLGFHHILVDGTRRRGTMSVDRKVGRDRMGISTLQAPLMFLGGSCAYCVELLHQGDEIRNPLLTKHRLFRRSAPLGSDINSTCSSYQTHSSSQTPCQGF